MWVMWGRRGRVKQRKESKKEIEKRERDQKSANKIQKVAPPKAKLLQRKSAIRCDGDKSTWKGKEGESNGIR